MPFSDPSVEGLAHILHKCRKQRDKVHALRLFAYMLKNGQATQPFVGNRLVFLLADMGCMPQAHYVFDLLDCQNEWSCNSLVSGYIRCGKVQPCLTLYEQMQQRGLVHFLKEHTFIALLKACTSVGDLRHGHEIHATVSNLGLLQKGLFLGTSLVDMYAKCGSLSKASEAFDVLPTRDVVTWNALLTAHADHGQCEDVLKLSDYMKLEGVCPDSVTIVSTLKACASLRSIDYGKSMHEYIKLHHVSLDRNLIVGTALVDMYAKCGLLTGAKEAFDNIPVRDVALWNVIIAAYVEHGCGIEAIECFERMQVEKVPPNNATFICTLKACSIMGGIEKCMEIHDEVEKSGLLETDAAIANCLVDTYCKCGLLSKAQEVFNKLFIRDVVAWTALITGYAEHMKGQDALGCFEQMQVEGVSADALTFASCLKACGSIGAIDKGTEIHVKIENNFSLERDHVLTTSLLDMYVKCGSLTKAQKVFNKLSVKDAISWNSLISGFVEQGDGEEALSYYEQMHYMGVAPTRITFLCSLKACSSIGASDKGQYIYGEIEKRGLLEGDVVIGNMLVDMYAKCGSLTLAQTVFNRLPTQDAALWNSLIAGCAEHGECENAFGIFERMVTEGIKPDLITFLVILNACNRIGTIRRGEQLFEVMSREFGMFPALEHHTGKVGLLCRGGHLDEALAIIKNMPFCPNLVLWHSVLDACRNSGNLQVGKRAFQSALNMDYRDAACYASMPRILAHANNHVSNNGSID